MSPHAQTLVAEQLPLHIQISTSSRTYQRREPETTVLHAIVREHLDAFLQHARDNYARPLMVPLVVVVLDVLGEQV